MDVLRLEIENFMAVSHAVLSLDKQGLVLVQGDNRDDPSANSNGAGKSSIPDALCWALFGKTARNVQGDAICNRGAGGKARVAVVLHDGSRTYQITRHRKHKQGKNALWVHQDGSDLTLGTDRLTQELVEQIIGCNFEVFTAAIYAGQEAMPDLPNMTDKELKGIVERAAGLDMLERVYVGALTDKNVRETMLRSLERECNDAEADAMDAANRLEALDKDEAQWRRDLTNVCAGMELEVDSIKDDLEAARIRLNSYPTVDHYDTELANLQTALQKIKDDDRKQRELDDKVASADLEVQLIRSRIAGQMVRVKGFKDRRDGAAARLGTPCGECGRPLTENELESVIQSAVSNLYKEARELQGLNDAEAAAVEAHRIAQERAQAFSSTRTHFDEVIATERNLRSDRQQTIDTQESIKRLSRELKGKQDTLNAALKEKSPYTAVRERTQHELDQHMRQMEALLKQKPSAELEYDYALKACEVFGPSGVRATILDSVTPYLNDRTSKYLSALSDGSLSAVWHTIAYNKSGEVRERFNIEVTNSFGADSFAGLSGGEKRKVRLACALALQDLVATRASKPINLWIGDEVDHALDDAGLERLMNLLEDKARERGTVLVISHNALGDWIRNTITVTKQGGSSTISGCLEAA